MAWGQGHMVFYKVLNPFKPVLEDQTLLLIGKVAATDLNIALPNPQIHKVKSGFLQQL